MASDKGSDFKSSIRKIVSKALKATVKGVIFFAVYIILWQFLAPVSEYIPGFQQIVETFVIVCIVLIIAAELTSGTIFQHVLNTAKALFVIAYLMLSLKTGFFGLTIENATLTIDARMFLIIAMLLGLLGLAKAVMQTINFVNEKAELTQI